MLAKHVKIEIEKNSSFFNSIFGTGKIHREMIMLVLGDCWLGVKPSIPVHKGSIQHRYFPVQIDCEVVAR